jgi:transcriptional regulator with XRE-family HTH domain
VTQQNFSSIEMSTEERKEAISRLIQDYLKREGRSVGWLAQQVNVHRTTLSRILHRKVLADAATYRALAETIGLPSEKILTLAGYLPGEADELPELDDPELGFYLSQIGKMPYKTREIVKTILREEYRQLRNHREVGVEDTTERPHFAKSCNTRTPDRIIII